MAETLVKCVTIIGENRLKYEQLFVDNVELD